MSASIADIEDELIEAFEGLKDPVTEVPFFRVVDSIGRKDTPAPLAFPAIYVYFLFDRLSSQSPRPVFDRYFDAVIANKNLKSEKDAAQDTYALIEMARDAVVGKDFGLTGVGPFECLDIRLQEAEGGVVFYTLGLRTKAYLPVPTRQ